MAAVARPAMSRGRAPNSAGATTNDRKTIDPTPTPSATTCAMRSAVIIGAVSRRFHPHPLVGGPLEGGTRGRPPQGDPLDLLRQREIALGDAAGDVGLELHGHFPPGHVEIGMVPRRLAQEADGVDQ